MVICSQGGGELVHNVAGMLSAAQTAAVSAGIFHPNHQYPPLAKFLVNLSSSPLLVV